MVAQTDSEKITLHFCKATHFCLSMGGCILSATSVIVPDCIENCWISLLTSLFYARSHFL
jgi:hypothetical protein